MTRPARLRSTLAALIALCLANACSSDIYLRDGVTDGDTFYLSQRALVDDDPVLQSWVSYSLSLAACKLTLTTENPARASSYGCELTARRHLVETWNEKNATDPYLDTLAAIAADAKLAAYVAHYFRRPGWQIPAEVDVAELRAYMRREHPGHRPKTRITGSWNYAEVVQQAR